MSENQFRLFSVLLLSLLIRAHPIVGQLTPVAASSASPSPTPTVFSRQTLSELKQLEKAALESDYAYRQVAHLTNNIGPRLSGSAQAAKAVEYVVGELKALGCTVQLEKVMVPHWVRDSSARSISRSGTEHDTENRFVRARRKRGNAATRNRSRGDRRQKF